MTEPPQAEPGQGRLQGPRECRDAPQAREHRDQGRQDDHQGARPRRRTRAARPRLTSKSKPATARSIAHPPQAEAGPADKAERPAEVPDDVQAPPDPDRPRRPSPPRSPDSPEIHRMDRAPRTRPRHPIPSTRARGIMMRIEIPTAGRGVARWRRPWAWSSARPRARPPAPRRSPRSRGSPSTGSTTACACSFPRPVAAQGHRQPHRPRRLAARGLRRDRHGPPARAHGLQGDAHPPRHPRRHEGARGPVQRLDLARPDQLLRDPAGQRREPRVRHPARGRPDGQQPDQGRGPRHRVLGGPQRVRDRARTRPSACSRSG